MRIDKKEGRDLAKTRESIGVSQADLAKRAGVTQVLISMIEAGKRPFTKNSKDKIYGALSSLGREIAQTVHSPSTEEELQELRMRYLGIKEPALTANERILFELAERALSERNVWMRKSRSFEEISFKPDRIFDKLSEYNEELKQKIASDAERLVRAEMLIADLYRLCGIRTEAIVKTEEADALHREIEQRSEHETEADPLSIRRAEYKEEMRQHGIDVQPDGREERIKREEKE